jgi:hypothetical protein
MRLMVVLLRGTANLRGAPIRSLSFEQPAHLS